MKIGFRYLPKSAGAIAPPPISYGPEYSSVTTDQSIRSKGQLNSEWIYEVIVSPKMLTKFEGFLPWKFIKVSLFYHLCVECFSQLLFDSEVYTKSATAADFVYISESNESCDKHSTQR